jgi:hypothetical protein
MSTMTLFDLTFKNNMNSIWDDNKQILFINFSTKNLFLLTNSCIPLVEQYK